MALGTTLKIAFDSSKVKSGLAGVRSSVASIAKAGLGIAKVGAALTALGIAGVAAVGAIVGKLDEIGSAGRAGDRRLVNITKQMSLFGDQAQNVADRLIDAADAEAQLTGMDPQLVQTKLMTFKELAKTAGDVGSAFDRATTAALDMAAAGFGTAEMNAVQLGKALNDPVKGINSLTRSGITFTAQEKAKIATLVQSNRMLEAQSIILKAIETQVGGTAAATATASSRMRASMALVVESFAEPMSQAFDQVPGKFQAVMPRLMEMGGKAGTILADAISDSINGNQDRFITIGKLIGDTIGAAATAAFQAASSGIVVGTENFLRGLIDNEMALIHGKNARPMPKLQGPSFAELLEAQMINRGIRTQAAAVAQGNQGLVPGSGGRFQFAPPGSSSNLFDGNGNRVVEVLNRIENNTAQGAKM